MYFSIKIVLNSLFFVALCTEVSSQYLECYDGYGGNYQIVQCTQCTSGFSCVCAKIHNFQGYEVKGCKENFQNHMTSGCDFEATYQGLPVKMCMCDTSLCNLSTNTKSSNFILIITVAFIGFFQKMY